MDSGDSNNSAGNKRGPANGTWAAVVLIAVGVIVALLARRYREFSPPDTTQPATEEVKER